MIISMNHLKQVHMGQCGTSYYKLYNTKICSVYMQVRGAFITRESSNVDATQATMSRFGLFSQASLQVIFFLKLLLQQNGFRNCKYIIICTSQASSMFELTCKFHFQFQSQPNLAQIDCITIITLQLLTSLYLLGDIMGEKWKDRLEYKPLVIYDKK